MARSNEVVLHGNGATAETIKRTEALDVPAKFCPSLPSQDRGAWPPLMGLFVCLRVHQMGFREAIIVPCGDPGGRLTCDWCGAVAFPVLIVLLLKIREAFM